MGCVNTNAKKHFKEENNNIQPNNLNFSSKSNDGNSKQG